MVRCLILGLGLALAAPAVNAQRYPAKPITIIVASPAGGDTDAIARTLAEKLAPRLGQPVLVENKSGASGIIGTDYVAKAAPDGYTLLLAPSTFATAQLVLKVGPSAGYDVRNGFTPIVQLGTQPLFIAAGPGAKTVSLKEVIEASKRSDLAYASPGSGSPMHILGEIFNKATGANLRHVPYRGLAPALTDVAGGHVPLMWSTYGPIAPYLADGRLRVLGVAQADRSPLAPDVPTLAELGYKGVEVTAWSGLFAPKGLAPQLVKLLNGHLNEIIRMPEVAVRMKTMGMLPLGGSPETLAATAVHDLERFTPVIDALGIRAN